ncbi:MAG: hypothetical protein KGJ62_05425 [Armatimonadetes bacterium]|nr:hypothetical protein [Armatimonadota bacterium]MDE2206637.1 hypothetical protein [Armatimonadota bacterium]
MKCRAFRSAEAAAPRQKRGRKSPQLLRVTLTAPGSRKPVESLLCTRQHPFYVAGKRFVYAGELALGTSIVTRAGPKLVVSRLDVLRRRGGYTVYNLIVDGVHDYFVGQVGGGVEVHNGPSGGGGDGSALPQRKLHRVFGGEAPGLGNYYTTVDPITVDDYRVAAGLFPGNTGRFVLECTLNDTEGVVFRVASRARAAAAAGCRRCLCPILKPR